MLKTRNIYFHNILKLKPKEGRSGGGVSVIDSEYCLLLAMKRGICRDVIRIWIYLLLSDSTAL